MSTQQTTEELAAEALLGNRGYLESDIGFEIVGRACRLVLMQGLNDELDRQGEKWRKSDAAMQALGLDPLVPETVLTHIDGGRLHEGPHESLLSAPVEAFPNVSVTGYLSTPSSGQFDQFDTSDVTMYVETFCIAGPVIPLDQLGAFETQVHRKIQRTTEAVARVIRASGNLMGTCEPFQVPPVGGIASSTWLRSESSGQGERFLIQGSRLQYTMKRNHNSF